MPLFRCAICGCIENTALGDFWGAAEKGRVPACSDCTTGEWHGRFEKRSAVGMLVDQNGHLWSREEFDKGSIPPHCRILGRLTAQGKIEAVEPPAVQRTAVEAV